MSTPRGRAVALALTGICLSSVLGSGVTAATKKTTKATVNKATATTKKNVAVTTTVTKVEKATAKSEGQVTWYTADLEVNAKNLAKEFEKKYGIPVTIFRASTTPLLQRFATEGDAGTNVADVLSAGSEPFFLDTGKKYLAPLTASDYPNMQGYPKNFVKEYGVISGIATWGVAINTALVRESQKPQVWADLTKPEWKGKVLLGDPRTSPSTLNAYDFLLNTYGADYLRTLVGNGKIVGDANVGLQQLAAQAGAILVPIPGGSEKALASQGAPLKTLVFPEATGSEIYTGIAAKAPHPNAARLFLDYILTAEGQTAWTGFAGYKSVLKGIAGESELPPKYSAPNFALAESHKAQIYSIFGVS
jgi:iron(III) transport system substrate-binding protein